jgi:hypothetical protein
MLLQTTCKMSLITIKYGCTIIIQMLLPYQKLLLDYTWVAAYFILQESSFSKGKGKGVPLHAMKAPGGRGGIAPTHSQP